MDAISEYLCNLQGDRAHSTYSRLYDVWEIVMPATERLILAKIIGTLEKVASSEVISTQDRLRLQKGGIYVENSVLCRTTGKTRVVVSEAITQLEEWNIIYVGRDNNDVDYKLRRLFWVNFDILNKLDIAWVYFARNNSKIVGTRTYVKNFYKEQEEFVLEEWNKILSKNIQKYEPTPLLVSDRGPVSFRQGILIDKIQKINKEYFPKKESITISAGAADTAPNRNWPTDSDNSSIQVNEDTPAACWTFPLVPHAQPQVLNQSQVLDATTVLNTQSQVLDATTVLNTQSQVLDATTVLNTQSQVLDTTTASSAPTVFKRRMPLIPKRDCSAPAENDAVRRAAMRSFDLWCKQEGLRKTRKTDKHGAFTPLYEKTINNLIAVGTNGFFKGKGLGEPFAKSYAFSKIDEMIVKFATIWPSDKRSNISLNDFLWQEIGSQFVDDNLYRRSRFLQCLYGPDPFEPVPLLDRYPEVTKRMREQYILRVADGMQIDSVAIENAFKKGAEAVTDFIAKHKADFYHPEATTYLTIVDTVIDLIAELPVGGKYNRAPYAVHSASLYAERLPVRLHERQLMSSINQTENAPVVDEEYRQWQEEFIERLKKN
jgi:hypothetical protein